NLTLMNTKEIIMDRALQQSTNRIATDGVRLYSGGRKDFQETVSYVQAATFDNIGNFNNYLSFQGATVQIFSNTFKVTDIVEDSRSPRITGLAVQRSGNWLFVAREGLNSLHVLHKINGTLNQNLTFKEPKLCQVDNEDNLWRAVEEDV